MIPLYSYIFPFCQFAHKSLIFITKTFISWLMEILNGSEKRKVNPLLPNESPFFGNGYLSGDQQ
jgi:hypothetical protein